MRFVIRSCMGLRKAPAASALTRMRRGASSAAADLTIASIAPLPAEYATMPAVPRWAATEDMRTMDPPSAITPLDAAARRMAKAESAHIIADRSARRRQAQRATSSIPAQWMIPSNGRPIAAKLNRIGHGLHVPPDCQAHCNVSVGRLPSVITSCFSRSASAREAPRPELAPVIK
jgi:hypothetical protein